MLSRLPNGLINPCRLCGSGIEPQDTICGQCATDGTVERVKKMHVSMLRTAQVHAHQTETPEAIIAQAEKCIEDVEAGLPPRHTALFRWAAYLYNEGM